jgi:hypothetical protein
VPPLLEECPRLWTRPAKGFLRTALLALSKIANALTDDQVNPDMSAYVYFQIATGENRPRLIPYGGCLEGVR